ncbi:hypothetical protein [Catellatospora chokoriensis]|uniref:Uncharacterized protein n=1 Tax=Catellatospora chokoriensis TaxID=310353 RepID=A0A8J3K443_9ACTN|nr:hypothetical protein [Catellatospora chokoriensis]GIF90360.1 hypothetical protein Cch02nite_38040 [Catellatospora chokoriensis]
MTIGAPGTLSITAKSGLTNLPLTLDGFVKYAAGAYMAIVQWWLHSAETMQPAALDQKARALILAAAYH